MLDHGYIQIYTGDGKGKTTASLGLALRALGHGWNVLVIQFTNGMQDDNYYGEIATSKLLPSLEVVQFGMDRVVYSHNVCMDDYKEAKSGWQFAKEAINSGKYQLIILDELNIEYNVNYLDTNMWFCDDKTQEIYRKYLADEIKAENDKIGFVELELD